MPQIINTNIASLNAQRNLNSSQRLGDQALQRLSSGLRINSAKDDAAGLAISTRFQAQIKGTQVAIRNSGDAISLAQTAEGALNSMSTNLQRIRELALQSANDTNTGVDRVALQEEVNQLKDEIKVIAETTNFNGKKLLDGSFQKAAFQTGANVGDTISVSIAKLDTSSLGSATKAGISSTNSDTALVALASVATSDAMVSGDLVINGVAIGASIGTDDNASSYNASSSAIAKAAAINRSSDLTGVTAVVNENKIQGQNVTAVTSTSATVTLNGVDINLANSTALSVEQNLNNVAQAINLKKDATGVTASVVADGTTFRVDLSAADGRNITLMSTTGDSSAQFGLASNASTGSTYAGTYTLISEKGSDIVLSSNTGNIDTAGFEEGKFSGVNGGAVSDNATVAALATGDLVINGVAVGPSKATSDTASTVSAEGSAIAKAAAINAVSDKTGVTAKANANTLYSGDLTATTSATDITVNGVTISVAFATNDDIAVKQAAIMDAINAKSGQTGVKAEALDADSFRLSASDGRNITLAAASAYGASLAATTYVASVALESAGKFELGTNTGNIDVSGFRVGSYGGGDTGTKLDDIDISTVAGANAAVKAVDNALQTIASKQAELGAVQNRFQNTISNLETLNENLNAANSRIQDADFAQETAKLSKAQVLQQAGISILAQANGRPQQVLSLLQ